MPASASGYVVTGAENQIDTDQPPVTQGLRILMVNNDAVFFPWDNYGTPCTAVLGTNGDPLLLGIQFTPTSLQHQSGGSIGFRFTVSGTPVTTATPEPAALMLELAGLLALGFLSRFFAATKWLGNRPRSQNMR